MTDKRLLKVLRGGRLSPPPVWLMRQAGRYLPEYREVRARAQDFLDLCDRPDLAAEVTLQPLRRYPLDAAIVFADILLIPRALGQKLAFLEGEGPVLEAISPQTGFAHLNTDRLHEGLAPVYETLRRVSDGLEPDKALIGFAGAPWTVAVYMAEGRGPGHTPKAKLWAYQGPRSFGRLIDLVTDATIAYLIRQVEAGAEVLQLFDSWAGGLAPDQFERWCIEPTQRIVGAVKKSHPQVPIIGFPRGAGAAYADYFRRTGVDAIGLDTAVPPDWARETLQSIGPVQGNLDPQALVAGGDALKVAARRLIEAFDGGPHIFNLGHGIVPETPPDHVAELCRSIRSHTEGERHEHTGHKAAAS